MVENNYKFFGFGMRSAQEVGKRAVCAWVLLERSSLEYEIEDFKNRGLILDAYASMNAWDEPTNISCLMTSPERSLFEKPIGTWTADDQREAYVLHEALIVSLWALKKIDWMEPWDDLFSSEMYEAICREMKEPGMFLSSLRLRPLNELVREFNHATWMLMLYHAEWKFLAGDTSFDECSRSVSEIRSEYKGMRLAGSLFQRGENLLKRPFTIPHPSDVARIMRMALTRHCVLGWILNQVAYWTPAGRYSEDCVSPCSLISNN